MPETRVNFTFKPSVPQLAIIERLQAAGLTVPDIMRMAVSEGLKTLYVSRIGELPEVLKLDV